MASLATPAIFLKLTMNKSSSFSAPVMIFKYVKSNVSAGGFPKSLCIPDAWGVTYERLSSFPVRKSGNSCSRMLALGSGLESSITDQKRNDISLGNVKTIVESREEDKIHVRVDFTGEQTQRAFDDVLTKLALTAPPMPGFRRMKGGKTSKVPKSFMLQILGKDRVTKFLIPEIISISISDYVTKEDMKVKKQFKITQTLEELKFAFLPGSEFGFNATIEMEKVDPEAASSESP